MPSASASKPSYTPVADIPLKLQSARAYFNTHVTKSARWRKEQLQACLRMMEENEERITAALQEDVRKPAQESLLSEVMLIISETKSHLAHLDAWMAPEPQPTPATLLPATSFVQRDPFGVVLIISPFNYPFQLSLLPMLACISAGNCAILKPSELTPASSALLAELLPKYLDQQAFQVVTGSVEETTALLKERWDYIFFTGSEAVGKIVAKAAAEHLTPCTLELGGKSPVIVAEDADLSLAARRIMWGKCSNAGQTCMAPDYAFVPRHLKSAFIAECKAALAQFFPNNSAATSPDFARIINEHHTHRLADILDAVPKGNILVGGNYDIAAKYIEPTLLDSTLQPVGPEMQSELFGPILPVIEYEDVATVIEYINSKEKPLALYIFSTNSAFQQRLLSSTSSGGVSINDVMMHVVNPRLPFSGVGHSGLGGGYHGKWGFEALTHPKAVLRKSVHADLPQRYPPYTKANETIFRTSFQLIDGVDSATLAKLGWLMLTLFLAGLVYRSGLTIHVGFA